MRTNFALHYSLFYHLPVHYCNLLQLIASIGIYNLPSDNKRAQRSLDTYSRTHIIDVSTFFRGFCLWHAIMWVRLLQIDTLTFGQKDLLPGLLWIWISTTVGGCLNFFSNWIFLKLGLNIENQLNNCPLLILSTTVHNPSHVAHYGTAGNSPSESREWVLVRTDSIHSIPSTVFKIESIPISHKFKVVVQHATLFFGKCSSPLGFHSSAWYWVLKKRQARPGMEWNGIHSSVLVRQSWLPHDGSPILPLTTYHCLMCHVPCVMMCHVRSCASGKFLWRPVPVLLVLVGTTQHISISIRDQRNGTPTGSNGRWWDWGSWSSSQTGDRHMQCLGFHEQQWLRNCVLSK